MQDTIDIRPGEALDTVRLEPYLRERLPETDGPLVVRQFGGGHANLTYLVRFGTSDYVLRRPPHGPLPKGGHDMQREYQVLSVLYEAFPLAPRAYVLCTDRAVIGSDFVVAERRTGTVIRTDLPPELVGDAAACRRLAGNFIDALAALHGVAYERVGLAGLGRPEGYLRRQLDGWVRRWNAADTPDRPDAGAFIERLLARLPVSGAPAIVHNDYKLDNVIVSADDPTRLVAVLDWDMCTLGDPLADLGNVLALWTDPGDDTNPGVGTMPTAAPGFPTRAEITQRYAVVTGRDCTRATWYRAFNHFRYAAIAQQIYARFVRGTTSDERFRGFGTYVKDSIDQGFRLADQGI